MCHLPDFKKINPNAKEQTRTMAAYIYCILYEQITGVRASQTGCAVDFKCQMIPFKRLISGKRQPGGPGRSSEGRGRSTRSLEDVAKNGRSYTIQENKDSNQVSNSGKIKTKTQKLRQERQIVRRLSKPSERIGRTGRVDKNLGG